MNIKSIINTIGKFTNKHAPELLTGLGIGGIVTTVAFAIKATPKYRLAIDNAIAEKGDDLTFREKLPIAAKHYLPTIAMGTATSVMFIGSNYISHKRFGAMAAAYSVTEEGLRILEKKIEEDAPEVAEKWKEEKYTEQYRNSKDDIINKGHGQFKCLDTWTGQLFYGDEQFILSAQNELQAKQNDGDSVSVGEYIEALDLRETDQDDAMGWAPIDRFGSYERIKLRVGSRKLDGEPVLTVTPDPVPQYNYY